MHQGGPDICLCERSPREGAEIGRGRRYRVVAGHILDRIGADALAEGCGQWHAPLRALVAVVQAGCVLCTHVPLHPSLCDWL